MFTLHYITVTSEFVPVFTPVVVSTNPDIGDLGQSTSDSLLPIEGSSEAEILNAVAEVLSPDFLDNLTKEFSPESLMLQEMPHFDQPMKTAQVDSRPPFVYRSVCGQQEIIDVICHNVIRDMNAFGISVVDNFLGMDRGDDVLHEVLKMYNKGVFKDGQLVSTRKTNDELKTIRSDQITWIDGKETYCRHIGRLISRVDAVILKANQMIGNGILGNHTISGRTKVRYSVSSFVILGQQKMHKFLLSPAYLHILTHSNMSF